MAEQNNEKQTINFAGREIDKKEFGRRVLAKLGAWMDYQGLRGEERTDFIQAINDKMNGLFDGTLTSSEFGVIEGGTPNQENQYKQNGSRSEGFSLSRRHGFNPGENADIFLNGIAGTMDEGASTSRRSSKKAATWDKSLSAKQVTDSIFGEGNEETIAQLKLWADLLDPVVNGVRSTEGRKGHIKLQLDKYIERLNNGEFDISDEDREAEIRRIGELKDAINNNNSFQLGKLAPWVSNLLFTEENYYNTPEEKQAAEQQTLAKKGEDYIKNGGENPYNKETQSELWQAAEDARKALAEKNQLDEFNNYSIRSTTLRGAHFLPKWDQINDKGIFEDWDPYGAYGWQYMLDALYKVNTDYSGDLGLGADLYSGVLGIGGNSSTSNDTFRGIVPDRYIDEIVEPNDWLSGHLTKGSHMFRSANAYKGKYLSDYLNHFISAEPDRFRVAPNTLDYILPSMVDWNKGTAYVINRKMNQKSSIQLVNIADLLPKIKENNPTLYLELYQYYLESKKVKSAKQGGVLSAQFGGVINTQNTLESLKIDDLLAEISAKGLKNFDRQNLKNQVIEGNNVNLTTQDWMRIGSAAADLTSAIAAFAPGYGTAVAAVTGIGSSLTNLAADWTDPSISGWETAKNLGVNLGLDLVSLIPGLNIGAGAAKIVKPIAKLVPKLLPLAIGANMAPEFIDMLKKVGNGKDDFTANDLRILAQGMSVIAGTSRVGASTLKASKYNKLGYGKTKFSLKLPVQTKTGEFPVEYVHNGNIRTTNLTRQEIKDINAGGKDNALKLFRQKIAAKTGIKESEISFAGKTRFDKILPFMNHKLKPAGKEQLTEVDKTPEMLKFYTERFKANSELRAKHPTLSKLFKTDLEMLGIVPTTNPAHFWGNDIFSPSAFRIGKAGNAQRKAGLITQALSRVNGQLAHPTAEQLTKINDITAKRKTAQDSVKKADKELNLTKNVDSRIAYLDKIRRRQTAINTQSQNIENKINDINRISQLERRLNIAKNAKRGTGSTQQQRIINLLETEINNLKVKTGNVKDLNKELTTLQRKLANLKAMPKLILLKRLLSIEARIQQIKTAKTNEAQLRLAADNGRKQVIELDNKKAIIDNELQWATYNHYRDLVRRIYGLKKGGIIKASLGTLIPPEAEKKQTSQLASSNTGTVGEPAPNTGTTKASINTGSVGSSNIGSVGETEKPKPSSTTYHGYDNGFMPEEHSSIYPSDIMLTLLQLEGNNTAHRYNYDMTQLQLAKIPYHKTPMIYGYKVHTSKPIEDLIAQTRAIYNQMGADAARGTADQGAAFAYKLAAATKAAETTNPLTLRQSEFVLNSEDKAREAAYKTAESYHDVGDFNHEQDVKDYNDERDIWTQYLSQEGRIKMKDIALRQRGLAATSEQNYRRSVLARQAEYTYRRLSEKKATHPEDWTDDDEQQLEKAYRTWTQINTPAPINMPYAGFSNYYTAQRPLSNFSYWNN